MGWYRMNGHHPIWLRSITKTLRLNFCLDDAADDNEIVVHGLYSFSRLRFSPARCVKFSVIGHESRNKEIAEIISILQTNTSRRLLFRSRSKGRWTQQIIELIRCSRINQDGTCRTLFRIRHVASCFAMLFHPVPDRHPTASAPNPTVWDYKLAQMRDRSVMPRVTEGQRQRPMSPIDSP